MSVFSDKSTNHVLGVETFAARMRPDSRAGARLAKRLRVYSSAHSQSDLVAEMRRLIDVDAWMDAHPEETERARKALAELPELERPTRQLRAEQVLGEAELFGVKQFLFYTTALFEAAPKLLLGWGLGQGDAARAAKLMSAMHPQKNATPRFHLAAELSPALEGARVALRQNKKLARRLRAELEGALVSEYGGSFDIHGHYRAPEAAGRIEDPRLVYGAQSCQLSDPQLSALDTKIAHLQETIQAHEYDLRARLSDTLRGATDWLLGVERVFAEFDLRLAKARLRRDIRGCWAQRRDTPGLLITQGRDPEVEAALSASAEPIQAIDLQLDARPTVISGPNMGGKSVLLRLIGLCQWCAQHAMPVPAASFEYAPVGAIIYVGAEESLNRQSTPGLSSFGREVKRLVEFWETPARAPRLWLLDELGRGTHPDEGADIAHEVIESLSARGDRVVAATHFPRVAAMKSARRLRIAGLSDPAKLEALLADNTLDVQHALRAAMDYRPICADTIMDGQGEKISVPRDARLVARALGLKLRQNSATSSSREEQS